MVMSHDIQGVLISGALVCGVLFFGWALGKINDLPHEFSRKFVHIGVSCFYFVYVQYLYLGSIWLELALPVAFIGANLFIVITGKPKALASALEGSNRYGTVYYPLSLVILVCCLRILDIGMNINDFGAGVLVMGFGDGFAGLFGSMLEKNRIPYLPGKKTWLGSGVMLVVSYLVISLLYSGSLVLSLPYFICAFFAAAVEAFTPKGLDNITVPILVALFCMVVI